MENQLAMDALLPMGIFLGGPGLCSNFSPFGHVTKNPRTWQGPDQGRDFCQESRRRMSPNATASHGKSRTRWR